MEWEEAKARLEAIAAALVSETYATRLVDDPGLPADIRAALQRIEELREELARERIYGESGAVKRVASERDEARKQVKALEAELVRLRAAVSEWLKQECAPDCAACCVLDAALVEGKNEPA